MNNAREAREVAKRKNADDNIVLLTGTNARGSIQPIRGQTNSGVVKKQKTYQTYVNGERVRYFEDDEKYSLNEMVNSIRLILFNNSVYSMSTLPRS